MAERSEQMAERTEKLLDKVEEDLASISIGEMLDSVSTKSPPPFISMVPSYLRQVNEKAYEPQVISIGPYHRGKAHLRAMEQEKILILKMLLEERQSNDHSVYVLKMRDLEDDARKCYAEPVSDLNSDDFVKLLLLDGFFVVQIIRSFLKGHVNKILIRYSDVLSLALLRDLLLVENQIPFFVLWELFCMIDSSADQNEFKEAIFKMIGVLLPGKGRPREDLKSLGLKFKHLLDFTYHRCFHPSTLETVAHENPGGHRNSLRSFIAQLQDFLCHPSTSDPENNDLKFIRCATELQESGIKFKLLKQANTMFDIRFENGTLHIPEIRMQDYTEHFLRNLIAFEQLFLADRELKHASDYMVFMDYLIDSPKDVEILCQKGIIVNMLGDDKAVKTMINGLGAFIILSDNFYYNEVFKKVNRHCSRYWNRKMANLKHNYCNSPWALISFLAAALLLLFTVLQAVISVLTYLK